MTSQDSRKQQTKRQPAFKKKKVYCKDAHKRKDRFRIEDEAEFACKLLLANPRNKSSGIQLRVYFCVSCWGFHLSHKDVPSNGDGA